MPAAYGRGDVTIVPSSFLVRVYPPDGATTVCETRSGKTVRVADVQEVGGVIRGWVADPPQPPKDAEAS